MYDSETGFYYLRSRYYSPDIGRFINADGLVSTGQGFDGNNMFAYCGNNPVMRVDTSGCFWGIVVGIIAVAAVLLTTTSCSKKESKSLPYKTADEAAKAFSEETYSTTSYIRYEYGTVIYSNTSDGETTYNYTEPVLGHPHRVNIPITVPEGTTAVATAHTHPIGNDFSGKEIGATEGDIPEAKRLGLNAYVVGPSLNLMRYDVSRDSFDYSVCTVSPRPLTPGEKNKLTMLFQSLWDEHTSEPCGFGCAYTNWPTP